MQGDADPNLSKVLDQIWADTHTIHYNVYFDELRYEGKLGKILLFDRVTAWMVALTTTGSGIGGWEIFNTPGSPFIVWWAIATATASLLAITHGVFKIRDESKTHSEVFYSLRSFRYELESFRRSIRRDKLVKVTSDTVKTATRKSDSLDKQYVALASKIAPKGILETGAQRVQDRVNQLLKADQWL